MVNRDNCPPDDEVDLPDENELPEEDEDEDEGH
jgi:hypothetical protein